jgi:putative redox protein
MDLVLLGLAGCIGLDVVSILQKQRQALAGFEVRVKGHRAEEPPRGYVRIKIEYWLRGHALNPRAVQRAIELAETKICSVLASLSSVPYDSTFVIEDSDTLL